MGSEKRQQQAGFRADERKSQRITVKKEQTNKQTKTGEEAGVKKDKSQASLAEF